MSFSPFFNFLCYGLRIQLYKFHLFLFFLNVLPIFFSAMLVFHYFGFSFSCPFTYVVFFLKHFLCDFTKSIFCYFFPLRALTVVSAGRYISWVWLHFQLWWVKSRRITTLGLISVSSLAVCVSLKCSAHSPAGLRAVLLCSVLLSPTVCMSG